MNLNSLTKTVKKSHKRLGLGHGSGRGKTAGRGTKGQKAKGKIPLYFEGGAVSLIKRLPFMRGKGRNKSFKQKAIGMNIEMLNVFPKQSKIDLKSLVAKGLLAEEDMVYGVKILGKGDLSIPLIVCLPVSKGAEEKIKKAGGTIEPVGI